MNGDKINLRRRPGLCCPEPGCDSSLHDFTECGGCGHDCQDCKLFLDGIRPMDYSIFKALGPYDQVKAVLRREPDTRDGDKRLIYELMRYYGFKGFDGRPINVHDILQVFKNMHAFESYTRARRKIQNDEGLFRATEKVQEYRRRREEKARRSRGQWF